MRQIPESARVWAEEEFGECELGHGARRKRAVEIAAGVAERPAGKITEVFEDEGGREGAYRFNRSEEIETDELQRGPLRAALKRTVGKECFYVPVDGSSVTITDGRGAKGFGRVGNRVVQSHGLQVMSAIAVAPDGTPFGFLAQKYWARGDERQSEPRTRPFEQRESRYWFEPIAMIEAERATIDGCARPFYQLDRGADFPQMLSFLTSTDALVTIRANQDRRLEEEDLRLWDKAREAQCLGHFDLPIARTGGRRPRTARIRVRFAQVTVRLRAGAGVPEQVTVNAVHARELRRGPGDRLEWLLLTNHPVASLDDARLVIRGYATRWRIEEFHRTWKSTCRVEDSQLHTPAALERWATMLAIVAMRIQRLTRRARTEPDLPASDELSKGEIDALLALKAPEQFGTAYVPKLGQAVLWLAQLGGYTGKSSGGPPGAVVIGRGLSQLTVAARTLRALREAKKI